MAVIASGSGVSTTGDPATFSLGAGLTAGSSVILQLRVNGGTNTISGVTVGGNAATQDLTGDSVTYVYRYYSASGGETAVSIDLSASDAVTYRYIEDNQIDNADPIDTTVAYAASGEGFVTGHQFDITAGVPAAGGIAVAAARATSSARTWNSPVSGTTTLPSATSTTQAMLYKSGIAAGAVALNCQFTAAGNCSAMLITYNYAAAAGGNSGFLALL